MEQDTTLNDDVVQQIDNSESGAQEQQASQPEEAGSEQLTVNPFATQKEFVSALGETAGTPDQKEIIEDYPYQTFQDKLKVPYIERFNGNICVKNQDFTRALKHYSKALFGLKMIFDGDKQAFFDSGKDAVKYIAEIEIPTCLNLSYCYLKTEEYHYAIKYAKQVLDNDSENVKAYYRRGVAYTKIGEVARAKEDLNTALELSTD